MSSIRVIGLRDAPAEILREVEIEQLENNDRSAALAFRAESRAVEEASVTVATTSAKAIPD